jgi:hypothetical protein
MRVLRGQWVVAAVLSLVALEPAAAAGGRLEINQTCALVGCFPGDDAGFPVTIREAGSYVLTGNLSVTSSEQAISVLSNPPQVEIDLNGFQIDGPVSCTGSGASLSCAPAGGARGISGGDRVRVKNGGVSGFAGGGIALGAGAQLEGVIAVENGGRGIEVSASSTVSRCIAVLNGGDGIAIGAASVLGHSIAAANKGRGIIGLAAAAVVASSAVSLNGSDGIATSLSSLVQGNSAYANELAGIAADSGSTVIDNSTTSNRGNGVYAFSDGAAVNRNVVRANLGVGISLNPTSSYRENTLVGNPTAVFGGLNLGANFCNSGPCP